MTFSNTYKQHLNILIPYYRIRNLKISKDVQWKQANFYKDALHIPVCSSSVYCSLEKQKACVRDEVYELAAKKLGKRIWESRKWDAKINTVTEELFPLMDFKKEAACIRLLHEAVQDMQEFQNVLYYGEILWLFQIVRDFLENRSHMITEDEFYMLDAIIGIFKGRLYDLAIYYLYVYANYHEDAKLEHVLHTYSYENSCLLSNRLFSTRVYERQHRYLLVLQKSYEIEKQLIETDNHVQLMVLYTKLIDILLNIDTHAMNLYRDKLLFIIEHTAVSRNQLFVTYMNLGTIYLHREMYSFCLEYLEKALEISEAQLLRCYNCICYANHMLDYRIPQKYVNCTDTSKGDEIDLIVYRFYQHYDVRTNDENKRYILKCILPVLEKNDELYIKMCENELYKLCQRKKSYKAMFEWEEKLKKVRKK